MSDERKISFCNLEFVIDDEKIYLTRIGNIDTGKSGFAEVQICGENKPTHLGAKMANSSEGLRLSYVSQLHAYAQQNPPYQH